VIDRSELRGGYHVWRDRSPHTDVAFVGRGPKAPRPEVLLEATGAEIDLAWAEQRHGAEVLDAGPGCVGRGDALVSRHPRIAVGVAVADCVPVIVGGSSSVAAVHAGWRGIVAGIVANALRRFDGDADELRAWIGPAIGPCCYEVGAEVADRVAAASDATIVTDGPNGRPHLDLQRAVEIQLARAGIETMTSLRVCTRCDPRRLFSYRREGKGAGRNFAFAWRRTGAEPS
jgi:YfiH family protein